MIGDATAPCLVVRNSKHAARLPRVCGHRHVATDAARQVPDVGGLPRRRVLIFPAVRSARWRFETVRRRSVTAHAGVYRSSRRRACAVVVVVVVVEFVFTDAAANLRRGEMFWFRATVSDDAAVQTYRRPIRSVVRRRA